MADCPVPDCDTCRLLAAGERGLADLVDEARRQMATDTARMAVTVRRREQNERMRAPMRDWARTDQKTA